MDSITLLRVEKFFEDLNHYKEFFPDKNYTSGENEDLWDLTPNNVYDYTKKPWDPSFDRKVSLFTALAHKEDLIVCEMAWNYSITTEMANNKEYFWKTGWELGFTPKSMAITYNLPENITNQLIFLSNKSRTKNDLYEKIKEIF